MHKLVNIFDQVKTNPMTAVGAKYSNEDILKVWTEIAKHIIGILEDEKGVVIKGLGSFTLHNWSLETGNNHRTLNVRQPIFLISKLLADDFDLHQPKEYTNDAVPLTPVCYHRIGKVCQLTKEAVVGCIEEVTQCFRKLMSCRRNVSFPMDPLGNLTIIETKVVFTFYNSCQRRIEEKPKPCAKFPTAYAPYRKKYEVPCAGHAATKF